MHLKPHKLRDIEEEIMEALFDLHLSLCDDSYLKMKQILERIGPQVSKTQLTNIVQRKLEKLGYVRYTPYEGVRLTDKGFQVAQKIARNHRLAEAMLFQLFHMPFNTIHEQACLLEHSISDEMAKHIYAALPEKKTPFGIMIPMSVNEDFACSDQTIIDTPKGSKVVLTRISIHNYETATRLLDYGIKGIGEIFIVLNSSKKGVVIDKEGSEYLIPLDFAATLFVDPV
ncbi:MAG: metal-dependent transcriptional regulator [Candidatus Hodarchaeales archaeon]